MKWLFLMVVVASCCSLGLALVLIDSGQFATGSGCVLFAIGGFLISYRMQSRYLLLDDI